MCLSCLWCLDTDCNSERTSFPYNLVGRIVKHVSVVFVVSGTDCNSDRASLAIMVGRDLGGAKSLNMWLSGAATYQPIRPRSFSFFSFCSL
jgi:hypothetical protein